MTHRLILGFAALALAALAGGEALAGHGYASTTCAPPTTCAPMTTCAPVTTSAPATTCGPRIVRRAPMTTCALRLTGSGDGSLSRIIAQSCTKIGRAACRGGV